MPQKIPHQNHPAVDWSKTKRNAHGKEFVTVVCPHCQKSRWCESRDVAGKIREGTFSGSCYRDRARNLVKGSDQRPPHPCVDWDDLELLDYSDGVRLKRLLHVAVTCPQCGTIRRCEPAKVAQKIRQKKFTGSCKSCGRFARKTEWVVLGPGRKIEPRKGYVYLAKHAVPEKDRHLWDALVKRNGRQAKVSSVLEHRFVMSVALGRAVTREELVDHMDGVKTNNHISNLRIYRRGKNDPGSGCGYGTFYHEWQLAIAEVNRLKAELAKVSHE